MATALCVLSLLPISVGALVTTLDAGMAFADWPTSDGQNMLLYPWLSDLRTNPEKFTEHGHRLAGMLLGIYSIVLVAVVYASTRIRWVRRYSLLILLAVIAQGILGGSRVLLNEQVLAMVHSFTGAAFFCLCVGFALSCSETWRLVGRSEGAPISATGLATGLVLVVAVLCQYILGSSNRHLHVMLHEHIAGAVVVGLLSLVTVVQLWRCSARALRVCAIWLAAAVGVQIALGLGAYVTKMGLPSIGYVAVVGSFPQSVVCSAHTVGGILLLATTVASAALLIRCTASHGVAGLSLEIGRPASELRTSGGADGGVA